MRYLLISNLYNEEANVNDLFYCVESQTRPPNLWLIIDDGSTDRTHRLLLKRAKRTPLKVRIWSGRLKRMPNYDTIGVSVRKALLSLSETTYASFDYYCVLDADSRITPGYFSELLDRMERDPKLGMASGIVWVHNKTELTRSDLARGSGRATKGLIWRSVDREDLPDVVSDAFFNAKTKMLGSTSKMFDDLRVCQTRPTTQRTPGGRTRKGRLMAMFWYNPLILVYHAIVGLLDGQSPLPIVRGYMTGLRGKRIRDPDVKVYFGRRMIPDLIKQRFRITGKD